MKEVYLLPFPKRYITKSKELEMSKSSLSSEDQYLIHPYFEILVK